MTGIDWLYLTLLIGIVSSPVTIPAAGIVIDAFAKHGLHAALDWGVRVVVRVWFAVSPWRLYRVVRHAVTDERAKLITTDERAEDQDGQLSIVEGGKR